MEASDPPNGAVFGQDVVPSSVIDAVLLAGEVGAKSLEGLPSFVHVHCAANELDAQVDITFRHWPEDGAIPTLRFLTEGTVSQRNR